MTVTELPIVIAAQGLRSDLNDRWRGASPTTRTRIQVAVFVGVVVIAYHYSLSTLLKSLSVDTPLAYIGLVPFIALGLAAVRSRPVASEPAIHDRQVDFIVGVPLMSAALAINVILPRKLSAMFWVWRIDLLSLPFFVAGAIAIIFGVRALWRQRLAVAYLFLVWPLPYSVLLLRDLNAFTSLTLLGLRTLLHYVPVASLVPSSGGSVFSVAHGGRSFPISVVSACSGVNGMVGFLLVGTAFGVVVKGPRLRKGLWLMFGLFTLWVFNLFRLVLIFWAGQNFGEHFALKVLHPFVGLITFNLGVIVMLLLLKPAGLRLGASHVRGGSPSPAEGLALATPRKALAVPAVQSAIAVVVMFALIVGVTNTRLSAYDLVAQATGEPKLASFLSAPATPDGWRPTFSTRYDWAKPYFGESSQWFRYVYAPTFGSGNLRSNLPITADVINTSDLSSFSAYGVEACYRFHGYKLRDEVQVNLGGGITGQALSYTATGQDWSIVYWIWPVKQGSSTRYERVILYMLNDVTPGSVPVVTGITSLRGSLNPRDEIGQRLIATRTFMVAFAQEIIHAQSRITPGAQLIADAPAAPDGPARRSRLARANGGRP